MTNSKSTKRALVSSALAILMCVAMLIGTTFAWFTDTASTGVNKITSGNLHVEIQDEASEPIANLEWVAKDGRPQDEILWEPGATYTLTPFKIANTGKLALKYKMVVTGLDGDADLLRVIKFTYKLGDTVLDLNEEGHLAAGAATGMITVSATMDKNAGNEYMDKTLEGVEIKVYATQDTVEKDSFDDQYDKDAPLDFVSVGTVDELKNAFKNVKAGEPVNVSLTGDVTISDATLMVADENTPDVGDINIQGNGHTITNTADAARCVQLAKFTSDRKITISGAKIVSESTATDSSERRGVQIFSVNNATINLVNCEIEMKSNDYSFAVKIGGTSKNVTVNLTGCTLTAANCIESFGTGCTVNITDCVFNSNYAPHATYCGQGIQDKNGTNNTYNIKNTTFNGENAQPWESSTTTVINDLGGNVYNTTRTTN